MIRRLLAVATLTLLALTAAPRPATAQAAPDAEAGISLLSQPIAVAPDGRFPALVAIAGAPSATQLVVDIYDRVEPGEVVGVQPEGGPTATFEPIDLEASTEPQRTSGFTIALYTEGQRNPDPAWGHRIDEPGVYPIRVRLQDAEGNRLAIMMTSLVRLPGPDQEVTQTLAALLVRVHRPPPDDATTRRAADAADDSLLADLDPVLSALDAHPALPATFAATPDTVARISGDAGAADDLRRLRAALSGPDRTLLDAPYVDLQPASLVADDLAQEISRQRDLGRQALTELLEAPTVGTWKLDDRVDTATLGQLRRRGISRTVLPGDALQRGAGVLAPVDLDADGGTVRAVTASAAFALGPDADTDPVLAAHRLLGRLAAAGPSPSGGAAALLITIDPAEVTPASLQIVLDALQFQTPFYAAAPMSRVLDARPDPAPVALAPVRRADLGAYPATLQSARTALNSYEAMVAGRNELVRPFEMTLAVSAARDLALAQRTRDAASVRRALQEPFSAISVPVEDSVTLGARDATFPLPIESTLPYPVQVVIELKSSDRLEFPRNRIEATLHEGRQVISVRVHTRAPGATPVRITVRSPDDGVALAESTYRIRSSAVSGVGIVLTVGAALFLAVWWGRHWHRNRDTARHARGRRRQRAPEPDLDREHPTEV